MYCVKQLISMAANTVEFKRIPTKISLMNFSHTNIQMYVFCCGMGRLMVCGTYDRLCFGDIMHLTVCGWCVCYIPG